MFVIGGGEEQEARSGGTMMWEKRAEQRRKALEMEAAGAAKVAEAVEVVEAAETVETVETVETAKAVEAAEAVEVVETAEVAEVAEAVEAVETAAIAEAGEKAEAIKKTGKIGKGSGSKKKGSAESGKKKSGSAKRNGGKSGGKKCSQVPGWKADAEAEAEKVPDAVIEGLTAMGETEDSGAVSSGAAKSGGPDGMFWDGLRECARGQLLKLVEHGDIRAIKLFYDLDERERKAVGIGRGDGGRAEIEDMSAIRLAVFGCLPDGAEYPAENFAADTAADEEIAFGGADAAVREDGVEDEDEE